MRFRKMVAAIAAVAAVLGGGMLGGAASASADTGTGSGVAAYDCGDNGHNNSDGVLEVYVGHMRSGPYESCAQTQSVRNGATFYAWCGVYNRYGNWWVYGRIAGTETKDWIYGQNLILRSGSVRVC
ncbi:hypothetical protein [Streptomyces sp. WAC 06738]|uniref:hypothetical protein n=1 Tax=Streptomyces sp. WAC 06738 TaxID=2203210 RepID=UPI000F76C1D2|nr:hypothetical protein [Streptomyces sp. WAC 06738]